MKALVSVALAALVAPPPGALAQTAAPELTITQNAAGEVVASVSAQIAPCGITANGDNPTFQIDGTVIRVTQPLIAISCVTNPPPYVVYQRSVDVGALPPATYTVSWNFPAISGSYTVVANGFRAGPGITGNWFDPTRSGQGFVLEVQPDNTLLAEWFTFAPDGGQAWIVASGPITGDTAVLQAWQAVGAGARFFPNFDPAGVRNEYWGTLTLVFSDCNSAVAAWQPVDDNGYSAGSMTLRRLTLPAGLSCP